MNDGLRADGSRQDFLVMVEGRPAPQGSKKSIGHGRFIESSKYLPAWRSAIVLAIKRQMLATESIAQFTGPVRVQVTFYMDRPKRPRFNYPATTPDIDKLLRGCFDAISTSGLWVDDKLVVDVHAREIWAGNGSPAPGAKIYIEALD